MSLTLVTAPAPEPLTTDQAKLHLRVDSDEENTLIDTLILSARVWVEQFTHRALMTQTWDYKLDAFPCGAFELPLAPVASVTSITYVDTTGTSQTWSSSEYQTSLPSGPEAQRARIQPAYGYTYPLTRDQMDAVTVRFVAGYGATVQTIPDTFITAIKMLVEHWYTLRGPVMVGAGNVITPVPLSVESMLWPFKAF